MYKAWRSCFLLLVIISAAAAIKCYVCKTADVVGCEDPFDREKADSLGHLKECSYELFAQKDSGSIPPKNATFFCRKGYQHVKEKKNVYRSCGWEPYYIEGRQCYFTSVLDVKTTQCQCFEDGCNSAISVAPAGSLILVVSIMYFFSAAIFASTRA